MRVHDGGGRVRVERGREVSLLRRAQQRGDGVERGGQDGSWRGQQ